MKVSNEMFVSLKAEIADALMQEHHEWRLVINEPEYPTYIIDENGDERFSDEAQEIYNKFYDQAEEILLDCGLEEAE
tara:strand:+ start:598 stop:828 length:231 start_codon:yes stop_codon:yes gene_type:complete